MTLVNHPLVQSIRNNPDLLKEIWATLTPNLSDLRVFLEKGESQKYDSISILGRWKFDLNAAYSALRRAKPNMPSSEMQKLKRFFVIPFSKTTFVAMIDHQALLKDSPPLRLAPTGVPAPNTQTLQGQWKQVDAKYQLTLPGEGDLPISVDGERLTLKGPSMDWVFNRED
jgi:hypothetical protein